MDGGVAAPQPHRPLRRQALRRGQPAVAQLFVVVVCCMLLLLAAGSWPTAQAASCDKSKCQSKKPGSGTQSCNKLESYYECLGEDTSCLQDDDVKETCLQNLADCDTAFCIEPTPLICEKDGSGVVLPLFESEYSWPKPLRAILYFIGLLWSFIGVGIIADVFMAAIEVITAKERVVQTDEGATVAFRVWNSTVANLTLMALGSSAPEILLSVVEIVGNNFFAGALGPATIVGSAAFNLFVIIAVCVIAIPDGDGRKIEDFSVYLITVAFSMFAYLWVFIILQLITPNVVDIWEAVVTLLAFPILVAIAYGADTGMLLGRSKVHPHAHLVQLENRHRRAFDTAQLLKEVNAEHGGHMTVEEAAEAVQAAVRRQNKPSRAQLRIQAMRMMTGGKRVLPRRMSQGLFSLDDISDAAVNGEGANGHTTTEGSEKPISISFARGTYAVIENEGHVDVLIVRDRSDEECTVNYKTEGVTATANVDYEEVSGTLTFSVGETEKTVSIKIFDDDEPEDDEVFTVALSEPSANSTLGKHGVTHVTIVDDDDPGMLGFRPEDTSVDVIVGASSACVTVSRFEGSLGVLRCKFHTEAMTASPEDDYEEMEGEVVFEQNVLSREIHIPIKAQGEGLDKCDTFKVVLHDIQCPSKLAGFHKHTECIVTIKSKEAEEAANRVSKMMNSFNLENYKIGTSSWSQQFKEAFEVEGDEEDEDAEPGTGDYVMHYISLPWKLLFALVPPTDLAGGWLCFVVSLLMIGVVTAIIGDLASLLGCVIGLKDSVTAITFVALGTSLPDTFASKMAAENDDTADASIVNVTGSNSVNVFLGLGLPWTVAAIYWNLVGKTTAWEERYGSENASGTDESEPDLYQDYKSGGHFAVPAGDLAISVAIFLSFAVVATLVLLYRRRAYGVELGGPPKAKWLTFWCFVSLWFLYVLLSALQSYGHL